jgi:hypothetical protein
MTFTQGALGRMSISWNRGNLFSSDNDLPWGRGQAPHDLVAEVLGANGNIGSKYALFSARDSGSFEGFDERSVYRPRVWGRTDD